MRPRTCSCGRALRRVRSRIASPTATAIPCSTPTNATVSSVITASANSNGSKRAIASRSRPWKIRAAMNSSTPASVATGTSLSSPAAGTSNDDRGRRAETGCLRAAGRGGHRRGPRRARVDRETPRRGRPRCCRRRRRGSRGRRRPRSRPGPRTRASSPPTGSRPPARRPPAIGAHATERRAGQTDQPEPRRTVSHRCPAPRRHRHVDRSAATRIVEATSADERAGEPAVDALGGDHDREHARAPIASAQPFVSPRCADGDSRSGARCCRSPPRGRTGQVAGARR